MSETTHSHLVNSGFDADDTSSYTQSLCRLLLPVATAARSQRGAKIYSAMPLEAFFLFKLYLSSRERQGQLASPPSSQPSSHQVPAINTLTQWLHTALMERRHAVTLGLILKNLHRSTTKAVAASRHRSCNSNA